MPTIPELMRKVRKARPLAGSKAAWWYVNRNSIDVFTEREQGGTACAKLTRKQLERALEIMDLAE